MKGISTPRAFVTSFGHMLKIKEILRLKCEAKLSNRKIARALNISHSVVNDYIKEFEVPLEGISLQTRDMRISLH